MSWCRMFYTRVKQKTIVSSEGCDTVPDYLNCGGKSHHISLARGKSYLISFARGIISVYQTKKNTVNFY